MIAEGEQPGGEAAFLAGVQAFQIDVPTLLANADLGSELFGPSTLLVRFSGKEQVLQAARSLGGHLTATIHGTDEDLREFAELIQILRSKVGRIVFNGYPTGVEVCHAMIHGGPYPASTDSRTTSVGTQAIYRFARPVCYQDFPEQRSTRRVEGRAIRLRFGGWWTVNSPAKSCKPEHFFYSLNFRNNTYNRLHLCLSWRNYEPTAEESR